jgi:uncharacterized protein
MTLRYYFLIIFFVPLTSLAQSSDSTWIVNHYIKSEKYVPMRDGVKLFTSIYKPTDSVQKTHPILLLRTPYSCAPYGKTWIPFWKVYVKEYLLQGYIVVFQDVRGRYMSGGDFVNFRPFIPKKTSNNQIDEATDAYDTIDWLIKNIHGNNGKVGTLGTSYLGFYAMMTGLSGHPALKAISPQAPVTELFIGDDAHHNGAFMQQDMFDFFVGRFGLPRPLPTNVNPEKKYSKFTEDAYSYFLQLGTLPHLTEIARKRKISFWQDLMKHPNYDQWWNSRNVRNYTKYLPDSTASLVVGGLFDAEDCYGALHLFKSISTSAHNNNKLVFGPWYHGEWGDAEGDHLGNVQFGSMTSKWYEENIELPFFNHYLKNHGSADSIARATVFFTGENKWHQLKQWPPENSKDVTLYLQNGGRLSFNQTASTKSFEEYTSDPAKPVPYTEGIHSDRTTEYMDDDQRFATKRTDVLTFETDTLSGDMAVAGPLLADLMVSISTTDADFVVKLIDVFPDNFKYSQDEKYIMSGYQMLVRGDVIRGKYRNSLSDPKPFVPGKITEVKYALNDVAHVFKKGHRIMVQVQSSWFPLVDRNPQKFLDIYRANESDFIKSVIRIHTSKDAPSKIILPVISN